MGSAALNALVFVALLSSCYSSEDLDVPVNEPDTGLDTELDIYIDENFTQEYGMAIRYKFVDNYVSPTQRVTPPRIEAVRPMLDFIEDFWIDPYLEVPNGEEFFRNHVPAEVVFLGGLIFNNDGTVILGLAEAGAQITFTNVNAVDPADTAWRALQLQTVYHEFAHTVHQRYKLPNAFETFTPTGYTSAGAWFTLNDQQALSRGFVSPYATSSPNEDYAETVAFFLFDPNFDSNFVELIPDCDSEDCATVNEGRVSISIKLAAISDHYERVTGLKLESLREAVQRRL